MFFEKNFQKVEPSLKKSSFFDFFGEAKERRLPFVRVFLCKM